MARCKKHPRDADAWILLSTLYGQAGRFADAIGAAKKGLMFRPNDLDALTNLANALAALGRFESALEYYRSALEIAPDNPAVLTNLAIAYLHNGNRKESIHQLQLTIQHQPDFANAHFHLANIYFSQNDFELAEKHYRNAITLQARNIAYLLKLGICLTSQEKFSEAEHHLVAALKLEPHNIEALYTLGYIYMGRGETASAVNHLRQAKKLTPNDPKILCTLAQALTYLPELEGSLKLFETVLKSHPYHPNAMEGKATVLHRLGRDKECYAILRSLIDNNALSPSSAQTYSQICNKFGDCRESKSLLKKMVADKTLHRQQTLTAHFALGHLYDREQNYESAFFHIEKANQLLNYRYDIDGDRQLVEDLIGTFSEEAFAELPRSTNPSAKPIFIVGMPRSGTTLLEQIISCHPGVHAGGEMTHIESYINKLRVSDSYPKGCPTLNSDIIEGLAKHYLSVITRLTSRNTRVTDKMPANFRHIPFIHLAFPKAAIIHCTRNPYDTCLSNFFQHFSSSYPWSTRLEDIEQYYILYRKCMKHWSEVLKIPMLSVCYEDLVANQRQVTADVLNFLGLKWNDSCLKFYRSKRAVATASVDQVKEPMYSRSVGRWIHYKPHLERLGLSEDHQ